MNILHISPYVPSVKASHAGGVCMGKEVELLSEIGNVYILSYINDHKEAELAKIYDREKSKFIKINKFNFAINAILHLFKPTLFAIRSSLKFKIALLYMVKKNNIDYIHCEYTSMAQYVWIKKIFPHLTFNIVEHDVTIQSFERQIGVSKGLMKLYNSWQLKLVKKCEGKYCKNADNVFTLNEKDKKLLFNVYRIEKSEVLIPYYGIDNFGTLGNPKIKNSICFVGQMGRDENHTAALRLIKIFKSLKNQDYKLYIIGAHPKQELLNKASQNIIITGFVDSIEEYIDKCEIAVFPLNYGAGIKLKVLLSFGLGLPVITTKIGAEGIDEKGEVLIIKEDDLAFADEIKNLLSNKEKLLEKSKETTLFVNKNFNWRDNRELLKKIYR